MNPDILIPIIWVASFITLYVDTYIRVLPLRKDLEIGHFKLIRWAVLGPVSHWIKVVFLLAGLAFAPLFLVGHLAFAHKFAAPTLFAAAIVLEGLDIDTALQRAEARGIDPALVEQSMAQLVQLLDS